MVTGQLPHEIDLYCSGSSYVIISHGNRGILSDSLLEMCLNESDATAVVGARGALDD